MINGDYYIINEKEKTLEFILNSKIKDKKKIFKLGELLVEFLNLDLEKFEKNRKLCIELIENIDNPPKNNPFSKNIYKNARTNPIIMNMFITFEFFAKSLNELNTSFSYLSLYTISYSEESNYQTLLSDKFNLLKFQKQFIDLITFCFQLDDSNNPSLKNLSTPQLLSLYSHLSNFNSGWINTLNIIKTYELFPNDEETTMKFLYEKQGNLYARPLKKSLIKDISKIDFKIIEVFNFYDIPSLLYTELMKLIELNFKIKKCKNCNRYFVAKGNYNEIYCNHVEPGQNRTCKQIGATKTYYQKLQANEITKIYNRYYKKYYARIGKGSFSQEKFYNWCVEAKKIKEEALSKNLNINQFKNKIAIYG